MDSLPFDVLNTTGISLCCVDNTTMRETMQKCGITEVPTLLTKYFNRTQQQISGTEIYAWISAVADKMGYTENTASNDATVTDVTDVSVVTNTTTEEAPPQNEDTPDYSSESGGGIVARALNMQKSRDSELLANKKTLVDKKHD